MVKKNLKKRKDKNKEEMWLDRKQKRKEAKQKKDSKQNIKR